MKTATVADLRNDFRQIAAWIEHGETVQIVRRGPPYARFSADRESGSVRRVPKVDFMKQLQEVWGDRVFSDQEVQAMRESELGREGGR